jgi:hypothetical protein
MTHPTGQGPHTPVSTVGANDAQPGQAPATPALPEEIYFVIASCLTRKVYTHSNSRDKKVKLGETCVHLQRVCKAAHKEIPNGDISMSATAIKKWTPRVEAEYCIAYAIKYAKIQDEIDRSLDEYAKIQDEIDRSLE